jgi:hypothetical protein
MDVVHARPPAFNDDPADVARHLFGEPNKAQSTKRELRFGTHGSLAVPIAGPKAGSFYDHELGKGGWLIDRTLPAKSFAARSKPDTDEAAKRLGIARHLWSKRRPIKGTPGERYLREARGYDGPMPPTIAYLPAHGDYQHAVIAAFGFADEIEPGVLHIRDDAVRGVHLIQLLPDGSDRDRAHPKCKSTIGKCPGAPLVVAPFPDTNNALVICEGIEDALSAHQAMGIAAWAAGGACRMPALADNVPDYIDAISVMEDNNPAGRVNTAELIKQLHERLPDVEVRKIPPFNDGGA